MDVLGQVKYIAGMLAIGVCSFAHFAVVRHDTVKGAMSSLPVLDHTSTGAVRAPNHNTEPYPDVVRVPPSSTRAPLPHEPPPPPAAVAVVCEMRGAVGVGGPNSFLPKGNPPKNKNWVVVSTHEQKIDS